MDRMGPHLGRRVKIILSILFAISAVQIFARMIEWHENSSKIPYAAQGTVCLFTGEITGATDITDIDATEDCIYIAYSTYGVVAVYGWDGSYLYSMSFFSNTKGAMGIRCENGLLYVRDYAGYELVFSGEEQIAVYEPSDKMHYAAWYREETDTPISIKNGAIFDSEGSYIMQLPGA